MSKFRAKVLNGRIIVDEPTTLPDGTVLDVIVLANENDDDENDDLTDEERAERDEQILRGWKSGQQGKNVPAKTVMDELRRL